MSKIRLAFNLHNKAINEELNSALTKDSSSSVEIIVDEMTSERIVITMAIPKLNVPTFTFFGSSSEERFLNSITMFIITDDPNPIYQLNSYSGGLSYIINYDNGKVHFRFQGTSNIWMNDFDISKFLMGVQHDVDLDNKVPMFQEYQMVMFGGVITAVPVKYEGPTIKDIEWQDIRTQMNRWGWFDFNTFDQKTPFPQEIALLGIENTSAGQVHCALYQAKLDNVKEKTFHIYTGPENDPAHYDKPGRVGAYEITSKLEYEDLINNRVVRAIINQLYPG